MMYENDCNLSIHKGEHYGNLSQELFQNYHKLNRKRKFQTIIHGEIICVTWHPDRVIDWCFSEDEKKDLEKLWQLREDKSQSSVNVSFIPSIVVTFHEGLIISRLRKTHQASQFQVDRYRKPSDTRSLQRPFLSTKTIAFRSACLLIILARSSILYNTDPGNNLVRPHLSDNETVGEEQVKPR